MARGDIIILGDSTGTIYAVHANQPNLTNGTGGDILLQSLSGISISGLALQADATPAGGDGGNILIEAVEDILLNGGTLSAQGDSNQSGGYGVGGRIGTGTTPGIKSFTGFISWTNGVGNVQPTGTDNVGTTLPAASRGEIILQDCLAGSIDLTGSTFPNSGAPATTPSQLADDCASALSFASYVSLLEECESCDVIPTPTPTPTPEVTPTPTPTPEVTPTPTPTPEVTPTPTPEPTPTPTPEPSLTPSPTPTVTIEVTPTPTPEPTPTPTPEVTPTPTPSEEPSPTPTPTPVTELECTDPEECPTPTPTPVTELEVSPTPTAVTQQGASPDPGSPGGGLGDPGDPGNPTTFADTSLPGTNPGDGWLILGLLALAAGTGLHLRARPIR